MCHEQRGDLARCEGLIENSSDPSPYLFEIYDGYGPGDIMIPFLKLCLDNGARADPCDVYITRMADV